jgi:pyruvate/2-oxoglutarate dehydrogenase complex dihydrolipoamide acyltransferase (E2) component
VQASFTVAIHSQVDGKLQEVLFTEGQHVKKGDVLAKIDPGCSRPRSTRPGPRKQDQAQLTSAEKETSHARRPWCSRTSPRSRSSTSSRARSISSRPRWRPMTPRSRPRRPSSNTPPSRPERRPYRRASG